MISRFWPAAGVRGGTLTAIALASVASMMGGGAAAASPPGTIHTVAGGVGGPAAGTQVALQPSAIAAANGSLYIADDAGFAIRAISATTGRATNLAGLGVARTPADGAKTAGGPMGVLNGLSVDSHGNVVIGDSGNASICACGNVVLVAARSTGTFYGRAMTAGHVYLIAGHTGQSGGTGDGAAARSALLDLPGGVAVDPAGDVAIIDYGNDRIQFIPARTATYFGIPGPQLVKGDIYTLAGNGVRSYFGDGSFAWNALVNLTSDSAAAFDKDGNLIFADTENDVVRLIAAKTGTFYGQPMVAGDIYHIAGNGIDGHSGDGGLATSAELSLPVGITLDAKGSVIISDARNNLVRVLARTSGNAYGRAMVANDLYTIAGKYALNGSFGGDGGLATSAHLSFPDGVAVDAQGNVAIADWFNNRVRLVAAKTGKAYGQSMKAGHIYTVGGDGSSTYSGDGGSALAAQLHGLTGTYVDSFGNLIVGRWLERTPAHRGQQERHVLRPEPDSRQDHHARWNRRRGLLWRQGPGQEREGRPAEPLQRRR